MGQQNYIRHVYLSYVCRMSSEEYFFPRVKMSDSILAAGVLLAAVQSQSTSVECAPKLKPINFRAKCCNHLILQLSPVQSTIQSSSWIEYHHHNPLCKNPKAAHISLVLLWRTFTCTGQSSRNVLHQFLYCKCTVGRNCIKCNIAQYKSIALSQGIMMHLCYATRIRYAGTVLQLNEKILWSDQHIISFKYITYSYQNALQVWRFLGYQLNTVFGTVVNVLKTFDLWISNTNTV